MFIRYNRFIGLCLIMTLSCKDLKNWQSLYSNKLTIRFRQEMDEHTPDIVKNLHSKKLIDEQFTITMYDSCGKQIYQELLESQNPFRLSKKNLYIYFPIGDNSVKLVFKSKNYEHTIYMCYERTVSFISPLAGGLQQQYYVKQIKLDTPTQQVPIFKKYTIDQPVLLKADNKHHVTLYY